MSALLSLSVVINAFLLSMAIFNAITIIRPRTHGSQNLSFSLLVPCRNEAENVTELVSSLTALDHPNFEVIFIDDNSTDGTGDLLCEAIASHPSMKVVNAEPLPDGWMGKPWALSQGLTHATRDYIVTIDADVRLETHALSAMDAVLQRTGSDFLSLSLPRSGNSFRETDSATVTVDMDDYGSPSSCDAQLSHIIGGC